MKARVLICDDALFMREMIGRTLVEGGYEVVGTAATGAEAVKQYEELKPDLVTMDLIMPDMGGADALREIIDSHPDARVIVCSALGQEKLLKSTMEAGAKGFIVKPFKPEHLLEVAANAIK